jgi:hypothetical protein
MTAVSHIGLCNCSIPNFLIYEENLIYFFISVTWTYNHSLVGESSESFPRAGQQNRGRALSPSLLSLVNPKGNILPCPSPPTPFPCEGGRGKRCLCFTYFTINSWSYSFIYISSISLRSRNKQTKKYGVERFRRDIWREYGRGGEGESREGKSVESKPPFSPFPLLQWQDV